MKKFIAITVFITMLFTCANSALATTQDDNAMIVILGINDSIIQSEMTDQCTFWLTSNTSDAPSNDGDKGNIFCDTSNNVVMIVSNQYIALWICNNTELFNALTNLFNDPVINDNFYVNYEQ